MASSPIKIGLDLSCLMPRTGLTGVGYYTFQLMQALFARDDRLDFRLFASSARSAHDSVLELARHCTRSRIVRWPTRLKVAMWTRLEWPPIEWFTGPVEIAHGAFHLLPAAKRAKRMVTVFDVTVLRVPETHVERNARMELAMLRHAARKADAVVAISQSCKNDLVELMEVSADKVHVVYGGVSLAEFSGEQNENAVAQLKRRLGIEGDYFIHLGTLEPRKNLPRLLEAYARVTRRFRDCPRLVLAGKTGWKYDSVFESISSLGLQRCVIHTGYLSREDAVLLLRGAYACLYPSLYEGFGLPVVEAMAARVPVLTSNVSSLPEVVGDTGITVNPESVDEIEAGLNDLLDHREAALQRVEAAYQRARMFTWENSADALTDVYHKLVS